MTDTILVLNAGSSSIKFALHPVDNASEIALLSGAITSIGGTPKFKARDSDGVALPESHLQNLQQGASYEKLIHQLLDWIKGYQSSFRIIAVGHRVVHGGRLFTQPTLITTEVLEQLETLIPLAPIHQPANLGAIHAVIASKLEVPQIACFDTSFHRTKPQLAQLYGLPRKLSDEGIIKYGFHGLSYEYISGVLPRYLGARARGRVIVAHLGNGASMCALENQQSMATTMGFTALDGLIMGRRCGTLDAGVVLHLIQEKHMTAEQVQHVLYEESGLLGVSGISSDMQVLQASSDPQALEAIDLFCYRAACELSALVAALEGLDAIVFTAGIGENSTIVREKICDRLKWLGVELDSDANQLNKEFISSSRSKVEVLVIPTNEELVIAGAAEALLKSSPARKH